jgi:aconitate decarboxylase
MATRTIADWVENLTFEAIPPTVREAAINSFANYVGCAIGGHRHEATQKLVQSQASLSKFPGGCSLLGGQMKADPLQAALINAFSSHLHDYDDTHLSTVIHPTAAVAAALLAYVDWKSADGEKVSGNCFITALVAGIEVECLLGLAVYPSHYDVGWHITATVGSIGAAIAVAKAMKLPVNQLVNAIGFAAAQVNGMRRHFGSHAKPLGVAFAAQSGLQSAILARNGMTAATDAIEGKRGWIECVCPDSEKAKGRLDEFLESLRSGDGLESDQKWEVQKNTFKPFPCGIVIHPVIDGCSQLRSEGLKVEHVEAVMLLIHPLVLELTGKKSPKDGLEAKFSVYHGAACGLLFGRATPADFADAVVQETAVLRGKIKAVVDDSLRPDECRIIVDKQQGKVEKHVEHAIGSLAKPMTTTQLRQKFLDQVEPLLGTEKGPVLFQRLLNLAFIENVSVLLGWEA